MKLDLRSGTWINSPSCSEVTQKTLTLETEPHTDFWQRSYYGFRNDNAPALLFKSTENFTFTVRVDFEYRNRFDQCGILIYQDSENWFKASAEFENSKVSRLGSVVTNYGHSDWATSDIENCNTLWYRLSRRGPDFLVESSLEGQTFLQMRIFHLHCLGATTAEMGSANPPLPAEAPVNFGIYACSPESSSFRSHFSDIRLEPSIWQAHS